MEGDARPPRRLGFPVKVMARPDLKSNDTRRWQAGPHLRTSLECLDAILDHCAKHRIAMYRMSSELAPYATHPDMPQFHDMVKESGAELRAVGDKARELGIRLSFHPSQYVVLNSPDPELVRKSAWDLLSQAEMLDAMGLGPEAVMVIHVGGTYGDREASNARWVETWATLPEPVRRRLVLEHDDIRFCADDVLWIHGHTGVPLIFDHQHFLCLNPSGRDMMGTVEAILRTWPDGVRPKIHFSSPRTELRQLKRAVRPPKDSAKQDAAKQDAAQDAAKQDAAKKDAAKPKAAKAGAKPAKKARKFTTVQIAPVWTGHADYIHPFEFMGFMRAARHLDFDVMLEAKVKDMALLRLRPDMLRYAPDVAAQFGLREAEKAFEAEDAAQDEREVDDGAVEEAA